jgi:hypothetical protein
MKNLIKNITLALIFGVFAIGVSSANAQGRGNRNRVERGNNTRAVIVQQRNSPNSRKWYKTNNGRKVKRGYYNVRPYVGHRARDARYVRVWRFGRYYWVRRY